MLQPLLIKHTSKFQKANSTMSVTANFYPCWLNLFTANVSIGRKFSLVNLTYNSGRINYVAINEYGSFLYSVSPSFPCGQVTLQTFHSIGNQRRARKEFPGAL